MNTILGLILGALAIVMAVTTANQHGLTPRLDRALTDYEKLRGEMRVNMAHIDSQFSELRRNMDGIQHYMAKNEAWSKSIEQRVNDYESDPAKLLHSAGIPYEHGMEAVVFRGRVCMFPESQRAEVHLASSGYEVTNIRYGVRALCQITR